MLAVAEDPLPAYFRLPAVRWLGVGTVGALLVALVGTLGVVLPQRIQVSSARPDQQASAFAALLARKSRWLTVAVIAFGLGLVALGAVLVIACSRQPRAALVFTGLGARSCELRIVWKGGPK